MFEQVLPGNTKAILALLEKSEIIQKAYLAGGTALALQLGHRISYDLDFFTQEEADIRDIAAMKIGAVASRGTKRDFVDLYFICKETVSLPEAVQLYDKKYKNLAATGLHIMKSLVYFNDAEPDEMPKMLRPCNWEEVKGFFEQEVKKIALKTFK